MYLNVVFVGYQRSHFFEVKHIRCVVSGEGCIEASEKGFSCSLVQAETRSAEPTDVFSSFKKIKSHLTMKKTFPLSVFALCFLPHAWAETPPIPLEWVQESLPVNTFSPLHLSEITARGMCPWCPPWSPVERGFCTETRPWRIQCDALHSCGARARPRPLSSFQMAEIGFRKPCCTLLTLILFSGFYVAWKLWCIGWLRLSDLKEEQNRSGVFSCLEWSSEVGN